MPSFLGWHFAFIWCYCGLSLIHISDKTILNKVITYAEEQKASEKFNNVIADVRESFNAALDAAKEIAADPAATQDAIDAAWKALMTEIHKLGFVKGDITSLEALVSLAEGYDMNDYVEAGQAEFLEALKAAQDLLADKDNAMQAEIETAESNLLNAMLNLRYKADKSILEKVIAEANDKDANTYTCLCLLYTSGFTLHAIIFRNGKRISFSPL